MDSERTLNWKFLWLVCFLAMATSFLAQPAPCPPGPQKPIASSNAARDTASPDSDLGITFLDGPGNALVISRDGKSYLVDTAARTVCQLDPPAASPALPASAQTAEPAPPSPPAPSAYHPGDDFLFNLPTGRRVQRHGLYVNCNHRFFRDPAFHGVARGHNLLGLDSFPIPSFGFRYGLTSRLSVSVYRSPFTVGRVIEFGAAYLLADEPAGAPLNLTARFSIDGQNDFERNFTSNFELIAARSLGRRAQFYVVPTVSIHNRPLLGGFSPLSPPPFQRCNLPAPVGAEGIPGLKPCADTFSIGFGLSVDIRKTVALVAEVIPTLVNAPDLGIHRPPYSFGIQKKIFRHAFTFGFSTGPGTATAQRGGTRALLVGDPAGDKPSGLFVGFDLTRQLR